MKLLIDMGHPADIHLFKFFIWEMETKGHEVLITARKKDVTLDLLDKYGFDYIPVGEMKEGKLNLITEWIVRDLKILKFALDFNPDILIGLHNPAVSHVAKMLSKKSVIFTDTEHPTLANWITFPFADVICTPSCFKKDLGKKQICYKGYQELAYLHQNYFTPNPAVLDEIGLSKDDAFIILRFVSWGAHHDVGQRGIKNKTELVRELEKYGRVLITQEGKIGTDLEKYRIKVSPEKMHDLLYYASLYVGEGATMASEAAVLGTHAVFVNTLRLGYTDEEEEKYNLVYNFADKETMEQEAFDKALELLENNDLKQEGKNKRERLLEDKIDVTAFMCEFVEHYPDSFDKQKEETCIVK